MKIFGKVVGVIYTIAFTVLLLVFSFALTASKIFDGSFYADIIKNTDLKDIDASIFGFDEGTSMEDVLKSIAKESGLKEDEITAILEDDEIKDTIGDLFGDIAKYTVDPQEVPQIDKKDVEKILEDKNVSNLIGEEFSKEDIDKTIDSINSALKDFLNSEEETN